MLGSYRSVLWCQSEVITQRNVKLTAFESPMPSNHSTNKTAATGHTSIRREAPSEVSEECFQDIPSAGKGRKNVTVRFFFWTSRAIQDYSSKTRPAKPTQTMDKVMYLAGSATHSNYEFRK
jgi:hypothetical protein